MKPATLLATLGIMAMTLSLVAASAAFAAIEAPPAEKSPDPWKDPEFQKRFLGTYGVLNDLEPRLTAPERAELEKVIPLMSTDLAKAAEQLAAVTTPDSSALFDFTLGNIAFQSEKLEEAAGHYQAAVAKFPGFLRAHKNLGLVSYRLGRQRDAIVSFTRMIELGGGDALTFGLLGQSYAGQQDFTSAESAYRQASMLQPDSMDWKLGLVLCLFKESKYGEAAALSGELIELHPDRVDLWLLQANAWIGLKEPMKAAQNYEMLARMGKASVEILNTLGDIYLNESLGDLAARSYLAAMEQDPAQGVARPLRAAELLAARGAVASARDIIARVKQTQGDRLEEADRRRLLKLEARIAMTQGADEDAARVLEEIVGLDPLDGEAYMLLGQHYSRKGDPDKAIFAYERAESIEGYEAEARVRHAQVLVNQARYGDALPLLRRAQELKPRDEVARYLEQVERIARASR